MVKYLIQDIIPPQRKRQERMRDSATEESSPSPERTIQHQVRLSHPTEKKSTRIQPMHHKDEGNFANEPQAGGQPAHAAKHQHGAHEPVVKAKIAQTPKFFEEQMIDPTDKSKASMVHRIHGPVHREGETTFFRAWLPWIFGLFGVVAVVLFALNYFGGAVVTVTLKKDVVSMDQKMSAFKNPTSTELPFSVMKVAFEETKEVPATGEKVLTTKASGKIIVYNKQTTTQRLIKNTRFQSPTGKIYRINDSINVPKATTVKGKITPGSIEATIFADEAGPDFNSVPTDFTLPGLKGSPVFEKVYGRGKGAITGGASGTIKTVTDADLKTARDELRVQLETKLRGKARSDLAPSQISYENGIIIELEEATLSKAEASSKDMAVVSAKGSLYMVVFDKELLTKATVNLLIKTYKGETVTIANLEALTLDLPPMKGIELWDRDRLDFELSGDPVIEWSIDEEGLRKVLYGVPKQSFKTIMAQFQTIENAEAVVRPAWKRVFPSKAEEIEIKIIPAQ